MQKNAEVGCRCLGAHLLVYLQYQKYAEECSRMQKYAVGCRWQGEHLLIYLIQWRRHNTKSKAEEYRVCTNNNY